MNPETERLADLLHQAYFGEAGRPNGWHGRSFAAIIRSVDPASVNNPIVPARHSALEIVRHVAFWDEVCCRRLRGERLMVTTGDPEDWPDGGAGDGTAWDGAIARLHAAQLDLVGVVRAMPDESLLRKVPGWRWTNYLMIHGTLHHDLYHAGQIALASSVPTGS